MTALPPQPGGVIQFLAHEIEVKPVNSRLLGVVVDHLARNAIEIIGAAEHHEVVRPSVEIALDPDIAESADFAVQVNPRSGVGRFGDPAMWGEPLTGVLGGSRR